MATVDTLDRKVSTLERVVSGVNSKMIDNPTPATKYGLVGDGSFHSIRNTLPSVTLSDVQSLNSSATLDNSVDWYAIQKALGENKAVAVSGSCVIDLPIRVKSGGKWLGAVGKQATITNIGADDAVIIGDNTTTEVYRIRLQNLDIMGTLATSGNGIHVEAACMLYMFNCKVNGHGINGLYSGNNDDLWVFSAIDCHFDGNHYNGIKMQHYYAYQKNNLSFINCRAQGNGYDSGGVSVIDLNNPTEDGHGLSISGTAINIVGGDYEQNAGAGVYLGGLDSEKIMQGITVTGNYLEPNKLSDIYIENSLSPFEGAIGGNYLGSKYMTGAKYTGVYVTNRFNIAVNSNIENNSLFYMPNKTELNFTGYKKVGQNKEVTFPYVLFKKGLYELRIDYNWTKITTGASMIAALYALDYDGDRINKSSTSNYKASPSYATLTQPVLATDTVLHFDNLTGWNVAYNYLVAYDTVLSNGKVVGTEYSKNLFGSSLIQTIDTVANTITFKAAIGKAIAQGTQCSLNSLADGGTFLVDYITLDNTKTTMAKALNTLKTSNITYPNSVYYLQPTVYMINASNSGDVCMINRLHYTESLMPNSGTTSTRPTLESWEVGRQYFDTSLGTGGKPIWWNGTAWKDSTGTTV